MTRELTADVLVEDGLLFPESPRWHGNRLYFVDIFGQTVYRTDLAGDLEVIAKVPGRPSGLGFLPDDRLLAVSMQDQKLYHVDAAGSPVVYADLSGHSRPEPADMVIDSSGRAYVGSFGYNKAFGGERAMGNLVVVDPAGRPSVAVDELAFPNGCVLSEDERTLFVAQTDAGEVTAFDVGTDGALSGQRTWAALPGTSPDGMCLDAQGALWVATANHGEVLRVTAGGEITDRVHYDDRFVLACMLAGEDRQTLVLCTSQVDQQRHQYRGRLETLRVDVPGAGRP